MASFPAHKRPRTSRSLGRGEEGMTWVHDFTGGLGQEDVNRDQEAQGEKGSWHLETAGVPWYPESVSLQGAKPAPGNHG